MEARATYADGSIVDITDQVTSWESSDPTIASISSTGMVQSRREGYVEFRATYGGLQGAWSWEIVRRFFTGPAAPDEIIGRVHEIAGANIIEIAYPRVEVSGGVHNGLVTTASSEGIFRIDGLREAGFDLLISKSGYRPLTVHVNQLGIDLSPAAIMEPDSSMISAELKGQVCWPKQTISARFTPEINGFIRPTSLRGSSALISLYEGNTLLTHFFINTDFALERGHTYELRATGNCDYDPDAITRITYLRPR